MVDVSEEDSGSIRVPDPWHIQNVGRISLGVVVTIIVQTVGLIYFLATMHADVEALKVAHGELKNHFETIQSSGSNAAVLLAQRVSNDEVQMNLMRERINSLDIRDTEFTKRLTDHLIDTQKIIGRIDVIDERLGRRSENDRFRGGLAGPTGPEDKN